MFKIQGLVVVRPPERQEGGVYADDEICRKFFKKDCCDDKGRKRGHDFPENLSAFQETAPQARRLLARVQSN